MHVRDVARLQGRRLLPRLRPQLPRPRGPARLRRRVGARRHGQLRLARTSGARAQRRGCPPDKPHMRHHRRGRPRAASSPPDARDERRRHARAAAAAAERRAPALEEGPRARRCRRCARCVDRGHRGRVPHPRRRRRTASRSCSRSTTSGSSEHVELLGRAPRRRGARRAALGRRVPAPGAHRGLLRLGDRGAVDGPAGRLHRRGRARARTSPTASPASSSARRDPAAIDGAPRAARRRPGAARADGRGGAARARERFGIDAPARRARDALPRGAARCRPRRRRAGERHDAPRADRDARAPAATRSRCSAAALEKQLRGAAVAQAVARVRRRGACRRARRCSSSRAATRSWWRSTGRVGWHFPQTEDGVYAGHHPARRRGRDPPPRGAARARRDAPRDPGDVGVVAGALRGAPPPPRASATSRSRPIRRRASRTTSRRSARAAPASPPPDPLAATGVTRRSDVVDASVPRGRSRSRGRTSGPSRACAEPAARVYAEIGVYQGDDRARRSRRCSAGAGELHLFDFEDRLRAGGRAAARRGHANVVAHPNSRRLLDSYNWSLMQLLRDVGRRRRFDYVFLDGAHTWAHRRARVPARRPAAGAGRLRRLRRLPVDARARRPR